MTWSDPKVWPNFSIVHCGVDPSALAPAPPRPDAPLRLLTVGRLEPIKGYPLLLDALARLKREGVRFTLEMVGSGKMDADLRARAAALDLADRVTFTGPVSQEDMPKVFDRADAMIVSSFMEGVPVVLMEAMAKELVVISTAVGGVPELVDHGVSGLIVPPGSVDALASAIRTLATDLPRLGSMRRAAREKILREFTVEHVADQMAELFRAHLPSPTPSRPG
jgi:glycosyltransferase involved in cell wall biosynthesis